MEGREGLGEGEKVKGEERGNGGRGKGLERIAPWLLGRDVPVTYA